MIGRLLSALSIAALAAGAAYAQDPAEPAADAAQAEAAQAEEQTLDATQVTTKDDAKEYGQMEFQLADANGDSKVNQEEFIAYAMAQIMAEADAENATLAAAEASAQSEGAAETAEASVETPAAGTQASEISPEKIFAEISGGKETVTRKAMIEARLANFDEADANHDATLDESEKARFANLVWGRMES